MSGDEKSRISGKDATNVVLEAQKYKPIRIETAEPLSASSDPGSEITQVPATEFAFASHHLSTISF